ncbi:Alpha/Beta hydrolase protein, partial [Blyttiomyces helicus]
GYAAGLGFFYRNYAGLSEIPSTRLYSIDWLGMANSSRPPFPRLTPNQSESSIVSTAESFFVDSLEAWREANGIDTMTLMGHSMGGYFSAAYALKYPERVEKLVLVSPAGIPRMPEGYVAKRRGAMMSLFRNLWKMNVTPMSVVRSVGPWGPSLVKKYTERRFAYLGAEDAADFHDYIFHISAQPGSGEYALARLLLPGAWGRIPLHDRLSQLKMPTTFI